jgi:hypothetical protein
VYCQSKGCNKLPNLDARKAASHTWSKKMKSKKDAAKPEMPPDEKITLDWLMKHVPFKLWVSFAAILLFVFSAGITAGQLSFVRELVSRGEEKKIQPVPGPGPIPPTPKPSVAVAKIEIRSPSDGDHVSGEPTFGASVIDLPLSHYKMFWQVDNGHLNPMSDSNESGPHKEAKVNVSSWDWKVKDEPYVITFVAEDSNGSRIADRSVNIFVDESKSKTSARQAL